MSKVENKKLAICVPYRNRKAHLDKFIPHLDSFLTKKKIDFKIFICHQNDEKVFNRGKVKNIAFDIARAEGYDYFAFHDIDLLPEDDSCDYSYPKDYPMHLSVYLSDYNYKLIYPENFGGVVLFTREQYEKVNGYYNDYWDWGAEDDDLYWRCKESNYVNIEKANVSYGKQMAIYLNGETSKVHIPTSKSIQNMFNSGFTVSMLVKSTTREDIPPYIYGVANSAFIPATILATDKSNLVSQVNCGVYEACYQNNSLEGAYVWAPRDHTLWTHIAYRIDNKKSVTIFINGEKVGSDCEISITDDFLNMDDSDLSIGKFNIPADLSFDCRSFKGWISEVKFWDKCYDDEVIRDLYNENIDKASDLVLYYNFKNISNNKVNDKSGNENHGKLIDCETEKVNVGNIVQRVLPHRREGKYKCLPHESDGFNSNEEFKSEKSAKNAETLNCKVKYGLIDYKGNGLSNLNYELIDIKSIHNRHAFVNVKC